MSMSPRRLPLPLPHPHPHHHVQQHQVHHDPAPGYMTPPSRAASPSTAAAAPLPASTTSTPPPPPSASTPPLTPSRDASPTGSTASNPALGPDVAVNDRATQRPFACTECGRTFWRKFDCIRHVRTHTRERPFPCAGCGRAFARKDALARHVQFAPVCLAAAADAELRAPMGRVERTAGGRVGKRSGGGARAAAVAAMAGASAAGPGVTM
ncbi:hypothetical protein AMAG_17331 [Allomyces macrogynus ATCC 38327]|uniref:C2H2-type domain-containing protein n=1 Tax=Allomyces macrogynus (strain ATCC 38327) TaxID=578462 RepID=A0A0L0TEQ9_ALLM3|nr:hypothetical protein AMAG_17331 [Allomyces macrogynus ATCC 38327]|eukprot:KNE73064.1 hypothetical protein AMAG_17331 [Allomyces macrogynus ATCC 38327]